MELEIVTFGAASLDGNKKGDDGSMNTKKKDDGDLKMTVSAFSREFSVFKRDRESRE